METQDAAPGYHIWGIDNTAYGPAELPVLVNWIKDERVLAGTWIFVERESAWLKASEVPELKMFFHRKQQIPGATAKPEIPSGALRRIKAFAEMTDEELATLMRFGEIVRIRSFTHIVNKGDPADGLYGVLEGELRSSVVVENKECPLATLGPGSIFGEISLFDKGPHTVDVISNEDSVLVKFSPEAVSKLSQQAPESALAFLCGLIKAIAGRVRTLTKRYEDSVHVAQHAEPTPAA
jgi:hypothetical protein